MDVDCVRVRRGATASDGRFLGITTDVMICVVCFDTRGLDSVVFVALTVDGFRLRGRLAMGFCASRFTTALVMFPNTGFF